MDRDRKVLYGEGTQDCPAAEQFQDPKEEQGFHFHSFEGQGEALVTLATGIHHKTGFVRGGGVEAPGVSIRWQDGPRGQEADGTPKPGTGAFVEDLIVACIHRLEQYEKTAFAHAANDAAIVHLRHAWEHLTERHRERRERGALGLDVK